MDCDTVTDYIFRFLEIAGVPNMRKIIYRHVLNHRTFQPILTINLKTEDGNVTELLKAELEITSRYSEEELRKINLCNKLLIEKGMPTMTDDEINYMLDPMGLKTLNDENIKDYELQRLAGFKIEKTITYFNDLSENDHEN